MRGDLTARSTTCARGSTSRSATACCRRSPYLYGFLDPRPRRARRARRGAARCSRSRGFPEALPPNAHLNYFRLGRGRLWIESGEVERGVAELLALGEVTQAVPFDNPALFAWRRFAVDGLLRLGRTDEARALADEELEIARRWGARHEIGASLRARGLVEGGAEGRRLLEEAVEMFDGTEAQLQHARALIDLGAAYRRDGQRTKAREVLTRGVDLALRTGVLGLVERGNEELAASGARPRKNLVTRPRRADPERAPRRRARRRRPHNKEIAQALFVTVKTVEVHLSSATASCS